MNSPLPPAPSVGLLADFVVDIVGGVETRRRDGEVRLCRRGQGEVGDQEKGCVATALGFGVVIIVPHKWAFWAVLVFTRAHSLTRDRYI